MCGIVGYVGSRQAAPVLLEGLEKLEYRGYDSAGMVVREGSGDPKLMKVKGRLAVLRELSENGRALPGNCGIGHTRWATHGEPSERNAHPHFSSDDQVVGVHNGIIENYEELKAKLIRQGYRFSSDTDTEVLINLVDYYYKKYKVGPIDALAKTMVRVRGSYALAVLFADHPGEIYAARKDSPLIVGQCPGEAFLASDVPAILKYTRDIYYLSELEMVRLTPGAVTFFNLDGDTVQKSLTHIDWDESAAEKGGYEHFMIKEIHEQPRALRDTLKAGMSLGRVDAARFDLSDDLIRELSQITIVGCGSAYHAGLVAQYVLEDLTRIPVRVELASEFRYRRPVLDPKSLVIVISQSGETADSKAALLEAKRRGIATLGIVNVVGSSIAREADHVFYTMAGPEIAVATTKAYATQILACYMLAIHCALVRGCITEETYQNYLRELNALPDKVEQIIANKEPLQWLAAEFAALKDMFYVGRGIDYAVSLEGSLKMKEVTYIHSEAYASGELKHGTISLIEPGTVVVGTLTQRELEEKSISNLEEIRARNGRIVVIAREGDTAAQKAADQCIFIPSCDDHFMASLAVVPMHLLGYYTSVARGLDVDKPRNLAKSVTVE